MVLHRVARTPRPAPRGAVLRLLELERRWCPSCTVTVDGNTLRIIGDATNNNVAIVDNGAAGIVVTCDTVASPAATGIEHVRVDTRGGDDTVTYSRSTAGGNFTGRLDFKAKLGSGNDSFTANLNGNDLVGTANVEFDIAGNAGNDTMTFNAGTTAAGVDIASGARLKLGAAGDNGTDSITVAYAGKLDGKLTVQDQGGADNDTVAATVALSAGSTGSLTAAVRGGGAGEEGEDEDEDGGASDGNDTLTLTVTGPIATGAR